ncbi:uncharacterized protein LOC117653661 [Thrips palmi]|uniref:Uncharacterized protein LOC117653661 n=1 Tax=Thrips palmi TaxID=161013 RepID=A0A6P9AB76_THRPL|nr:uncharacterized protein LOC117653661 [Thrips palmi]
MEAPDHNSNYIDEGISGISAPETPNNDVGSHHGEKEGNNFMDGTGCDDGISALASRSLYDDSMVLEPLETVTNVKIDVRIPNKSTGPCLLNTEGKSSEGKEFSCDKVTKDDQEIRNAIRAAELRLRATESPVRRELFHSSIQSSSGLSHSDEEVICLSDTEEFFPTQIKMESPDHNSDYFDEGISAPETPNYNVGSHHGEKEGKNFYGISSLGPGNPHNDSVDHEGSEMRMSLNVAKKQPNKSIGEIHFK